jgi:hypothetical protein
LKFNSYNTHNTNQTCKDFIQASEIHSELLFQHYNCFNNTSSVTEACGYGSWFGYRWDACEHWSVLATGVTPMSLWPLVTEGNLGAVSCLDFV